jgi:hypothetical protein
MPIEKHGLVPAITASPEELRELHATSYDEYATAYSTLLMKLELQRAYKILEVYQEKIDAYRPNLAADFRKVLDDYPTIPKKHCQLLTIFKSIVSVIHMFDRIVPPYLNVTDFDFRLEWYYDNKNK